MAIYARIDVGLPRDKRISDAGYLAELLYVRFILLCKELLSDGALTDSQLNFAAVGIPGNPQRHADRLAAQGLIERVEGGWRIDPAKWAKWQETRAQVETRRDENAKRLADWRAKNGKGNAKRKRGVTTHEQECNAVTNSVRNDDVTPPYTSELRPQSSFSLGNRAFAPPTIDEVAAYCAERSNHVDPQRFIDFYQSKGWKVGKNSMKDWRAAVRNWEKSDDERTAANRRSPARVEAPDDKYADLEIREA